MAEIDWAAYAPEEDKRTVIKHGTSHRLGCQTAVTALSLFVSSRSRQKLPHHVKEQMVDWLSNAVSTIDEWAFDRRLKTKEDHLDDKLNELALKALNKFGM